MAMGRCHGRVYGSELSGSIPVVIEAATDAKPVAYRLYSGGIPVAYPCTGISTVPDRDQLWRRPLGRARIFFCRIAYLGAVSCAALRLGASFGPDRGRLSPQAQLWRRYATGRLLSRLLSASAGLGRSDRRRGVDSMMALHPRSPRFEAWTPLGGPQVGLHSWGVGKLFPGNRAPVGH